MAQEGRDGGDGLTQEAAVSIVIPTYNRCAQLSNLLDSLDKLVCPWKTEVLIVDDDSTDATPGVVEAWCGTTHDFQPRLVRMEKNGGPAKARNLGIGEANGNVLVFTDDDCVVHRKWLVSLVSRLDSDTEVVGVGGRVLPLNRDVFSRFYTFHRILDPPKSLKYLVSANCCYRREPVVEVGGFDTDIRKPGGEDIGLSFKLDKQGHSFAFAKDAIVFHDYRGDLTNFARTFRNYGEGCRQMTEKYFGNGGRLR